MSGEVEGQRVLISFLVDTSFLISFADPGRPHHAAAAAYFREALQRDVPLYFSAIAASEFQVKQAVSDLPFWLKASTWHGSTMVSREFPVPEMVRADVRCQS